MWLTCFEMCRIQILHLESTVGHKKEWRGLTKVEGVAKTKRKDRRKKNGNEVKKTENKVWLASYHSFVCVCFFVVLFFVSFCFLFFFGNF